MQVHFNNHNNNNSAGFISSSISSNGKNNKSEFNLSRTHTVLVIIGLLHIFALVPFHWRQNADNDTDQTDRLVSPITGNNSQRRRMMNAEINYQDKNENSDRHRQYLEHYQPIDEAIVHSQGHSNDDYNENNYDLGEQLEIVQQSRGPSNPQYFELTNEGRTLTFLPMPKSQWQDICITLQSPKMAGPGSFDMYFNLELPARTERDEQWIFVTFGGNRPKFDRHTVDYNNGGEGSMAGYVGRIESNTEGNRLYARYYEKNERQTQEYEMDPNDISSEYRIAFSKDGKFQFYNGGAKVGLPGIVTNTQGFINVCSVSDQGAIFSNLRVIPSY